MWRIRSAARSIANGPHSRAAINRTYRTYKSYTSYSGREAKPSHIRQLPLNRRMAQPDECRVDRRERFAAEKLLRRQRRWMRRLQHAMPRRIDELIFLL